MKDDIVYGLGSQPCPCVSSKGVGVRNPSEIPHQGCEI